ncbi:glycerate kinase [Mycobacterium sp. 236(2023)]|uniref:glycerate kinase n=1 Tax=Mycobacterium sp. 236(2023) TaxID=3038163 RepID=UPI0024156C07|nr:glycerate kinase [Mycobacterium sp. 236(2023)]MDG4669385.1 glycerate kinase [Mycobacterium sp. 236(2023)]
MPALPVVVLAPDKFKGSLSAAEVAAAMAHGITQTASHRLTTVHCPIADGGEGTLDAAIAAGFGCVEVATVGPTGRPVSSAYARRQDTAVVEMADACGLGRLPAGTPQPLASSSRGLGIVVARALDDGCRHIIVGVGGSASTDGGAGFLQGLGAALLDADGHEIDGSGATLGDIAALDLTGLHPGLRGAKLVIATDVDNPLCGAQGAAVVYGPQKGAGPCDVAVLDAGLLHWADVMARHLGVDHRQACGAGAAGGVGFAGLAALDMTVRPGIDVVLDLVGIDEHLHGAAAVITGEGSLDAQSLRGKAPVGVSVRARRWQVPSLVIAGTSRLSPRQRAQSPFAAIYALTDLESDPQQSMARAAELIEVAAGEAAEYILAQHTSPVRENPAVG